MKQLKGGAKGMWGRCEALMSNIANKFMRLFEPEEVEVTFKKEGNTVKYTYKVLHPRQVA